jgi:glucose/arabinose dehydrogenase
LLAATTIEIHAAGSTGQEQMQLLISGQPVATFNNVGGNYNTGQFVTFSYTHPTDVSISQVRVFFSNNGSTSTGADKNLRVDAVTLNGSRFETEATTVFTTGTYVPGVGRGVGRLQSEFMHYDGYFQYGAAGTIIDVRAAGSTGEEQMQLLIGGQPVATFNNIGGNYSGGQYQTYAYVHPTPVTIDQVRVAFINNATTAAGDRNLRVDSVALDAVVYQTEAPTVLVSGVHIPNVGLGVGRLQTEFLHYTGYFQYGAAGTVIDIRAAGNTGEEQMQLLIGGQPVATFNNIGGNYTAGQFQTYVYVHPTAVQLSQVRVAFTNNATTAAGDRNLRVDSMSLDGVVNQTEAPSVLVSGVHVPNVGLGVGRLQTEFLHYTGYFQYGAVGTVVEIRAAGNTREEQMQLQIGGQAVATFNNIGGNYATRQFQSYVYVHPTQVALNQVRVAFTNNATTAAGDRNLKVDGVLLDGIAFQTEAADVYSTGTWISELQSSAPGLWQNENLHTTGYFQFASGASSGALALGGTLFSVNEAAGTVAIPVVRTGGSDGTVAVRYTTVDATAVAGADYTGVVGGLLVFGPGETTKSIVVPIANDPADEGNETFNVAIDQTIGGATTGLPRTATVTIVDDDGPPAPGNGNGLLGIYFADMALSTPVHEQTDAVVNFNWGTAAPNGFVGADNFSVRWVGQVEPLYTETYTFRTNTDDGVRLWVNGQLIINQWIDHAGDRFGTIALAAGLRYDLVMEYFENLGNAAAALSWSSASQALQIIPQSQLYSDPPAPPLDDAFVAQTIASGLSGPTAMDFDSTGRMFIAEQRGVVRVYQNGQLLPAPFIDIQDQVNFRNDRGMLGVAVHPDFPATPYVYVSYTYDPPETASNTGLAGRDGGGNRVARITRFTADAATGYNTAVPGSETVTVGTNSVWANISRPDLDSTADVTIPPSGPPNGEMRDILIADSLSHTVGNLGFGPDGMLYAANGDGTSYGMVDPRTIRVQSVDSLSGKILRVDPLTGQGLPDNPFYNGDPDSNRSKVYDYGLRNPFRFAFHPDAGELYIGDVGWTTWEEINRGRGENFGWPYYEGGNGQSLQTGGYRDLPEAQAFYATNPDVQAPLYSRTHAAGATAIVAGDFYTGDLYPDAYQNALFITDFRDNEIRVLRVTDDGTLVAVTPLGLSAGFVVEMTMGRDGFMYYVDIFGGKVGRLEYIPPAAPALLSADQNAALGDFDRDGDSDGADFLAWQRGLGTGGNNASNDLADWQTNFGYSASPTNLAYALGGAPFPMSLGDSAPSPIGAAHAESRSSEPASAGGRTALTTRPLYAAPKPAAKPSPAEKLAADEFFASLEDDPFAWVGSLEP